MLLSLLALSQLHPDWLPLKNKTKRFEELCSQPKHGLCIKDGQRHTSTCPLMHKCLNFSW